MPKIYGADTINETSVGGGISAIYKFSTTTTIEEPLSGYFRLNNANPASVTTIAISKIDSEGFTRDGLSLLRNGDAILFSSTHHSISQAYELTAEPVDNTTWYSLTVINKLTNGSFGNHDKIEVTAVFSGASKYTDLPDVPQSFTGDAGKLVVVNSDESGLEHTISITQDIFVNGLTVGRGGGNEEGNAALGYAAGYSNTTGFNWTALGSLAGLSNTTGFNWTALGYAAGYSNTTGSDWTALGYAAGQSNTTGYSWTALGSLAGLSNTTGFNWTALGTQAGLSNTTGSHWTALGYAAGYSNTTGSGNIFIGGLTSGGSRSPVFNATTENDRIVMGSTTVTNAYIKVAWTVVSDARDKTNFGDVPLGIEFVNSLKPISYQYKMSRDSDEPNGAVRYGFKAQEILELEGDNPVIIDADDPEKLRFNNDSLVAVLVNSIKELTTMVKDLQNEVNTLKGKT